MDAFAKVFAWLARPERKWPLSRFTFGIGRPGEVSLALTTWQALVGEKLELVYEPLTMALWVDFGSLRKEVLLIDTKLFLSYAWYTDCRLYIVRVNVFGVIENRMRLHFQSVADREAFMAAMPECFRDRCKLDPNAPPPSGPTIVDERNQEPSQGSMAIAMASEAATAGKAPVVIEQGTITRSQGKTVKARKRSHSDDEWATEEKSGSEEDTEYESEEDDFQKENSTDSLSETENDDAQPQPSSSQWYNKRQRPKKRRVQRPRKQRTVDILQLAMGEIEDIVSAEDEVRPVSVPCVPNTIDVLSTPTHQLELEHVSVATPSEPAPVQPPPTADATAVTGDISQPLTTTIEPEPPRAIAESTRRCSAATGPSNQSRHAPPVAPSPANSTSIESGPATASEPSTPIARRTRRPAASPGTPSKHAPPVTPSPAKSTSTVSEPSTPIARRTRRRSAASAFGLSKTLTPLKQAKTPAKRLHFKKPATPPKTPATPKEPIMTRRKALQLGVVIPSVMEEDTKAKTRRALSMEDELATEVDEAAAAAASLNLVTEQWFVDAGIEVQQYHAYGPIDHDMAAEDLAGFFHAQLSDSGFVGEDDLGAAENVTLPVPWNNDTTVDELIGGLPSVDTGLDQDNSVDAATLETPAVEPLMDEGTNVADADQQQTTMSKTCTRVSKKNAASQAAALKKDAAKRKDVRKEVVVGIGQRLRASRKYNLRSKKELQRSARHSTKASFR